MLRTLLLALTLPVVVQAAANAAELELRRSGRNDNQGAPIWILQLRAEGSIRQQWPASASAAAHQQLDRRWSPGNGSPLPKGRYRVGPPEPWGSDIWLQLDPLFPTSRSALGIHNCYPGVGCICLPDRQQLGSLADAVRRYGITRLTVLD